PPPPERERERPAGQTSSLSAGLPYGGLDMLPAVRPGLAPHPSGTQHVIRHGRQRAVVGEGGGGLREYGVDGFPVLDGFGPDEMATAGRGQVLAPWPNRLADGRYHVDGQVHQVPLSEPAEHNAIHGLVRWSGWDLIEAGESAVRMGHVLWPQTG